MNSVDSTTIVILILGVCLIFVVLFMCIFQILSIYRGKQHKRESDCGWEWCGTLHGGWLRNPNAETQRKSENNKKSEAKNISERFQEIKENNFLNFTLKDYLTDNTLDARSDSVKFVGEDVPKIPEKISKIPEKTMPEIVKPVLPNRNYQNFTCIQKILTDPTN